MKTIRLKDGKERAALRRHPWIFDTAIASGRADSGETVRVQSSQGAFVGWGAYSPSSKIRVRLWSFNEEERIDEAFFVKQIDRSVQARASFYIQSDAKRLIHAEADAIPGLIVDQYRDILVAQFLSAGVERFKPVIVKALLNLPGVRGLYERSDSGVRTLEGLEPLKGWLGGQVSKTQMDSEQDVQRSRVLSKEEFSAQNQKNLSTTLTIAEHEWKLTLDIEEGHKTGFYLDQRDSRKLFCDYVRRLKLKRILNCYCYTGGFTVAALKGMISAEPVQDINDAEVYVLSIDSSASALAKAQAQLSLNGLDTPRAEFRDADVNATLRELIKEGQTFDAIILDPPKFAPSASHADRAARAYKDINRLALKLLRPEGVLFTFSCSGGISAELFHKIVASAGTDAGVDGYIVQRLQASPDHPMTIQFPEGEYLKGLVVLKK